MPVRLRELYVKSLDEISDCDKADEVVKRLIHLRQRDLLGLETPFIVKKLHEGCARLIELDTLIDLD